MQRRRGGPCARPQCTNIEHMEGIAYNVVSMHNLEGVEGDHEGRPHVFERIGCNAVGAGLVPAPNAHCA